MGDAVTTAAIRAHLAEVYSEANGYACLFEVANGTGGRVNSYADAVVMSLWPSRGHHIDGYEIKISRSDWLRELKRPDKAWPVMQYCHHWFLLAAPGVAKTEEIPINWGWLEFDGAKIRVKKAATALEPKPPSLSFVASMVRRPVRDVEEMANRVAQKRISELEADFDRRVKEKVARESKRVAEAEEKLRAIHAATGIDLLAYRVDDEAIAAALKFAMSVKPFARYSGLHGAIGQVEGALRHLVSLQEKLAEFAPQSLS